ncbi:exo-alpha-sialidase, partial [Streptomyces daliensis]|nr:exo-alpha-sialidase [Streptomyces daliensis]
YVNVNETTGAELPDGRIYLNTRTEATAPGNRADAYSADGGETLTEPFQPETGLTVPVCEGPAYRSTPGLRSWSTLPS